MEVQSALLGIAIDFGGILFNLEHDPETTIQGWQCVTPSFLEFHPYNLHDPGSSPPHKVPNQHILTHLASKNLALRNANESPNRLT